MKNHPLEKPNKEPKAIEGLVGLDTRHAHSGDSPANFELQCISMCIEEKRLMTSGIRKLTEGITHRGETRVSSKLQGTCPIT